MGGMRDIPAWADLATLRDPVIQQRKDGYIPVTRMTDAIKAPGLSDEAMKNKTDDLLKLISPWIRIAKSTARRTNTDVDFVNGLLRTDLFQFKNVEATKKLDQNSFDALYPIEESYKLTWLYGNLTMDPGLMESSITLDGKMQQNDQFFGTRNRLSIGQGGFGSWLEDVFGAAAATGEDVTAGPSGKDVTAGSSGTDGMVSAAVIFVNFPIQAWWIREVSVQY